MSSKRIDVELFTRLAKLPEDVIYIIIDYVPRSVQRQLLQFVEIRKVVVSCYISNVEISGHDYRLFDFDEYPFVPNPFEEFAFENSPLQERPVKMKLENLKKAIKQWKIYPKKVHFTSLQDLVAVHNSFPELLLKAHDINGVFDKHVNDTKTDNASALTRRNLSYGSLELRNFGTDFLTGKKKLPEKISSLTLLETHVNEFNFEGLKLLRAEIHSEFNNRREVVFPPDLKVLEVKLFGEKRLNIPSNLVCLNITGDNSKLDLVGGLMNKLIFLFISSHTIRSFSETGINAPNLTSLTLLECYRLTNFGIVKTFKHLKYLSMVGARFPVELFDGISLPNLLNFLCNGNGAQNHVSEWDDFNEITRKINNLTIKFPPKLEDLALADLVVPRNVVYTFDLPSSLKKLHFEKVPINYSRFQFTKNLEEISLELPEVKFDKNWVIPPTARYVGIVAERVEFKSLDMLYRLPEGLEELQIKAISQGKILPLQKKIKWPSTMKGFTLIRFDVDYKTFEMFNFKESKLEHISLYRGKLGKLNVDALPVTLKFLSLVRMGITKLPDSMVKLKNLHSMCLRRNHLRGMTPVKLPIGSLHFLDVCRCDLTSISPFLSSMLEKGKENSPLNVSAVNNWYLNVRDVRRMLNKLKNFTITVSTFDEDLIETCRYSARLSCEETHYNENPEETDYSDDDGNSEDELYYGSQDLDDGFDLHNGLDENDNFFGGYGYENPDNVFHEMFRAMMRNGDID